MAAGRGDIIDSVTLSLKIATYCGTACCSGAVRVARFGKNAISLLLLLALPHHHRSGAADRFQNHQSGAGFTIVVGHATFCVVVVFNNVIARRRTSEPVEASMDLGADGWQTFRYVVLAQSWVGALLGHAGVCSVV